MELINMLWKRRIRDEFSPHDDEGDRTFDRLPDSLVLVVFDKVADARSLVRCSAVSKRFNGLVPLVRDVSIKIYEPVGDSEEEALGLQSLCHKPRSMFSYLIKLISFAVLKPFHHFLKRNASVDVKTPSAPLQFDILRNFRHVRNLKMELSGGDVETDQVEVLKWRAECGSVVEKCVILGVTGMEARKPAASAIDQGAGGGGGGGGGDGLLLEDMMKEEEEEEDDDDDEDEAFVSAAFDGPFGHAAKALFKRPAYVMAIDNS